MKKAIVIGSGIGGLAVAIRLVIRGYEVAVFEKASVETMNKMRPHSMEQYR